MTALRWHYPRKDFVARVYAMLATGPIQALSLFGPRRTGKTQFLTHDLAPLAESRGHRVVYASLWQTLDTPLGILLYEFDRALRSGSVWDRLATTAGAIAPKFKVKAPGGAGEMEIDLSQLKGKPPQSHLLLLDQYCERLAKGRKPALLLFDEFQELARTKTAAPLIAALRTSLDKRKDGLVAVFTGSSREGLRAMFSPREAPFFRFATPIDLPPLDDAFVDHQLAALKASSKAKVKRDAALEIFHRFDRNPAFFQRWLTTLALDPELSERAAVAKVEAEIAEEFGFGKRWLELNAIQRVTARVLAEKVPQVYGQQGADRIRELVGGAPPGSSAIQSALQRLSRLGIADRWEGQWRLSDPLFEAWVLDRPATDF
jgi:hypothetical protein